MDKETVHRVVETTLIAIGALAIFFGLKGRLQVIAERANLPRLAFTPVRLILRYSVLVLAIVLILSRWGYDLNGLLAVLGTILGLVAIGFVAVWSVLSNLLCTFVLVIFKPFAVGDELEFPADAISGKVVDLTLLFTTLRSGDREYVQVPNNMFFQKMFKRRTGDHVIDLHDQLRQEHPAG